MDIGRMGLRWLGAFAIAGVGCNGSATEDPEMLPGDESGETSAGSTGFVGGHAGFEKAHAKLAERYAFTDWKSIDWDAHLDEFLPLIVEADQSGDRKRFRRAIRQYGHSLPDAHIEVEGTGRCEEKDGGYGLILSRLDDGTVAVVAVRGAPGIAPGDRVLAWNGAPIDEALPEAPTWCGSTGLSTPEQREYEQMRWLVRAAPGTTATVTVQQETMREIDLVAADDDRWSLDATGPRDRGDSAVTWTLLANDTVGYVHIAHVGSGRIRKKVAEALTALLDAGAESLVLDVRDNDGGDDQVAADIAGHFHPEKRFYEVATWWDGDVGHDTEDETVFVRPQSPQWTGPVVVLVNHFTLSSGEGIAMAVGWSPRATIVGFEPSAASFGMTGGKAKIGDDIVIWFPMGRSLDENGIVQLDSDHEGAGGVHPTARVPWTLEQRIAWANGEDPELDFTLAQLDDG